MVEHEHGYRAAVATARALAVSEPTQPFPACTSDAEVISGLFADPRKLDWWLRSGGDAPVVDAGSEAQTVIDYLENQERMNQWI